MNNPSIQDGILFYIQDTIVGLIPPKSLKTFLKFPQVFQLTPKGLELNPILDTVDKRTTAVEDILIQLKTDDSQTFVFNCLKKWRNEQYAVTGNSSNLLMKIERCAIGLLGMRGYGCHLNGYVKDSSNGIKMWIAKRSATKQTYPGMLDNIVGGGLPYGITPFENIIKEAWEEASIPSSVAENAKSVSTVSYYQDNERGWIPSVEYVYDLELPDEFMPVSNDGEVEEFYLLDLDRICELVREYKFTPEAGLVVVDFMIIHGQLHADNDEMFVEIVEGLHRKLPFPSEIS